MDTQRSKFSSGTQKKGGKDSTRLILTASGGVLVGAGSGVAATTLLNDDDPIKPELDHVVTENVTEQQAQPQSHQEQAAQQTSTPQADSTPSEIQPVDNGQMDAPTTVENQHTTDIAEGMTDDIDPIIDDVDPDLIAGEITAVEVDPNDNDMADMINIDSVDTLYLEDGSEVPVALFHTPDGGQFVMVDIDNDLTFDVITDLEGTPIYAVEGNLTMSDIEDMMDDSGNELAFNDSQNARELQNGENPDDDVVVTDLASDDPWSSDDVIDEEELLAEEETAGEFEDETLVVEDVVNDSIDIS